MKTLLTALVLSLPLAGFAQSVDKMTSDTKAAADKTASDAKATTDKAASDTKASANKAADDTKAAASHTKKKAKREQGRRRHQGGRRLDEEVDAVVRKTAPPMDRTRWVVHLRVVHSCRLPAREGKGRGAERDRDAARLARGPG